MDDRAGVHLVVGGFPAGSSAGHDMDGVRLRLLGMLAEHPVRTSVANDFDGVERWLAVSRLLVTYTAGPYPDEAQDAAIRAWLGAGGRWLALHGTSGGKAVRAERNGRPVRMMERLAHHETLGGFFLNHPPVRRFTVAVATDHPLAGGLPERFEVADELYFVEVLDPACDVFLTTELPADPMPGFGFHYDRDTSLGPDGRTRALGWTRAVGDGAVAYVALGHSHTPATNVQPFVDTSVTPDGQTPLTFSAPWDEPAFVTLVGNGLRWGLRP